MSLIDITGNKYGKLTVIRYFESKNHNRYWLCMCECGKERTVSTEKLTSGHTRSCGCLKIIHKTHGYSMKLKEYICWLDMKGRCYRPTNQRFSNYGGRGITVCDRWVNSFENFLADMGLKPTPQHSLDRINNDGNYEPCNCKWSTPKEQRMNKQNTVRVFYKNNLVPLKNLCEELGISSKSVKWMAYWYKITIQEAFNYKYSISPAYHSIKQLNDR